MSTGYYLGIPGSFSYAAAQKAFGAKGSLQGLPSFKEIFAAVQAGKADYGVVPVENSLAGSIYENYNLLDATQLHVSGEQYIGVEHYLLGAGAILSKKLTKVYSHPKALEQCQKFFAAHPWVQPCPYTDTAAAARFVSEQKDPSIAAIASKQAAGLYGLEILAKNIEDNPRNFTRFLVITKQDSTAPDADKCSVILRLPHIPGSLHRTLGVLADSQCNLTKIESRPLVGKAFEYVFYLDFCFDTATHTITDILAQLKQVDPGLKVLGLYKHQIY